MAEADWTAYTAATNQGLDDADVSKGVSNGFTPPNGGGSFIHAFHALTTAVGVAGYYYTALAAFDPIATGKGGSISGAMRRYAAGTGYAPFLGFIAGTSLQNSIAYMLGLSDSDPYQYVLRKGTLVGGLDPTAADVLRVSDASFNSNTLWHHLKLDVLVNPQGDVVLNVFANDLNVNPVTTDPADAIPSMDPFTDDGNGILTGTLPLTSGFRTFFGMYAANAPGKVAMFDHIVPARQLNP